MLRHSPDSVLEVPEVPRVVALPAWLRLAVTQDLQELAPIVVRSHLRLDLEAPLGHVEVSELVGLPDACGDVIVEANRVLILHIGEAVVQGPQQEHDGREPLLPIDDLLLPVVILEGDDGPKEVVVVLVELIACVVRECEGEEVIPECRALVVAPCIGALIVRDEEVCVLVLEEGADGLLIEVEL